MSQIIESQRYRDTLERSKKKWLNIEWKSIEGNLIDMALGGLQGELSHWPLINLRPTKRGTQVF